MLGLRLPKAIQGQQHQAREERGDSPFLEGDPFRTDQK